MSTALFVVSSLGVVVGMVALLIAVSILRSAHRAEEMGNERLEILREQRERLEILREERELLLEELRQERGRHAQIERAWRENSVAQGNGRELLPAVHGALEEGVPRRRRWWSRIFDR
jgi:hypothetical protein